MMKRVFCLLSLSIAVLYLFAQSPVSLGAGSYASYAPLAKSRSSLHDGCQAYQTEHRRLYLPDSLLTRLAPADGSHEGTLTLPSNDWWTYALVNQWTGKLWFYPGWAEAKDGELQIGFPTYWEPTGCEVKWDTPLSVTFINTATGKRAAFTEALIDNWSDFMVSFIMQDGGAWVRVTCMQGSPLVWIETQGITAQVTNPDPTFYAVFANEGVTTVALLTEGLDTETARPYATRIPRNTRLDYNVDMSRSVLTTTFRIYSNEVMANGRMDERANVLMAFLPHHYYSSEGLTDQMANDQMANVFYLSPRGEMRLAQGNDFAFNYPIAGFLPFFPAPAAWKEGFSATRMAELNADYAARGTFGADTYWGGKGLTQMAHYMTFALQMGDTATYLMAKKRLRTVLENWYTYTPGEQNMFFARFPRWGAMVGFDTSYDSDTYNDHHFHYGYFIYASAVLCMLDEDFKAKYGAMAREVALDYACWQRDSHRYPLFRTFNPYCGHSFAGGMGNGGNGNGQESTSEAMQSWGGIWLLGAALGDEAMLHAGIFGYTVEAKATAEYWFDRKRRNIDYPKYTHPYCCNLTMQGVGWWTWFSGDPVWMHSIQWLPTSPILTNYFSQDTAFVRWDYTEMYLNKEVGDYEAATGGLGDESGLGNVCLSYLALFDADSAARVWDRMDAMGKPLAKNPDTGGITYWLAHSHRALGDRRYDIHTDHPMACAYTDTLTGVTTYAAYNAGSEPLAVRFYGAKDTTLTVPANALLVTTDDGRPATVHTAITEEDKIVEPDPMAWNLPYPNLALHKPVTVSSYENVGCVAANLTDGDAATRWGSNHNDNEWAIVDLSEQCYIDHIVLRWEAAYASRYELALSDDKSTWRTVELTSGGGVETLTMTDYQSPLTNARARYIRIKGIERATQYGTSLYELEAYGRPLQGEEGKLFVLAIAATDTVVMQGCATTITAQGYDAAGNPLGINVQLSVTGGEAQLTGNRLLCDHYGTVEVTGAVGTITATITIIVLETEQASAIEVRPAEVTLPVGETQTFVISIVNQFGAETDGCTASFRATRPGDTTVVFDCFDREVSALVHVRAYEEVNLALGKPASASGSENDGTAADKAVDGNQETRWSSRFQDNEWIVVDLEDCYRLTSVKLYWENAYATAYDIELSDDGESWRTAQSVTNATGGTQTIDLRNNGEPVEARFVRILCKTRNTGYGVSLWEIEIFGEARCANQEAFINNQQSPVTNHKYIKDGHLYISHNGVVYTISGLVFLRPQE